MRYYTIRLLPVGGSVADWGNYVKTYTAKGWADRVAKKLAESGLYSKVVVIEHRLQAIEKMLANATAEELAEIRTQGFSVNGRKVSEWAEKEMENRAKKV